MLTCLGLCCGMKWNVDCSVPISKMMDWGQERDIMANKTKATATVATKGRFKDEIDMFHNDTTGLTDRERRGSQNVLMDAMDCLGGADAVAGLTLVGTVKIFSGATPSVSVSLVSS